jgi:predicted transposase/invertase (TIGR01784 family)
MGEINKPHDKIFKETFGDLDVTTDFIQNYLPKEILDIIDVTSLEPLKDSFIQRDLRDAYSDLLFQVNVGDEAGYLYFLFEHKSYQSADIAFQLLGYMLQIWNQQLEKENAKELPIILPLVIYHGEKKWKSVKTINDWISGYQSFPAKIQRSVPNFEFTLFDFSIDSEETIKGEVKLRAYLELSRHIFVQDMAKLIDVVKRIEKWLSVDDLTYFRTVILYLLSARDDVPVERLKNELTKEGRKRLMSIAEQLRYEGELKKSKEIARELLLLGVDEAKIMKATNLTTGELEEIKKEVK